MGTNFAFGNPKPGAVGALCDLKSLMTPFKTAKKSAARITLLPSVKVEMRSDETARE